MSATLTVFIVFALIALLMPFATSNPLRFDTDKLEEQLKEELQSDLNNNDNKNFLDLRLESGAGKRSEFWQKFMKRSQEYGRDFNKLNKNDLKSLMKLKGKLTRVSDGIRFLVN